MNKKLTGFLFPILFTLSLAVTASGQRAQRTRPVAPPTVDAASYLPASDAIAIVDVKRLLNETIPSVLGGDIGKLAQANAELEKFKMRTGIDPRSFDRVAIGARYTHPTPRITKLESVAIADGTFDAKALAAATRDAAKGKSREEKYRGFTITIVSIRDQLKLFGLWDMRVNDLAVCVLDPNSLALGTPATVRAAIDAGKRGRAAPDLISLATRDASAVVGFGANLPRELFGKMDFGNDAVAKDLNSIRQAYGSIGSAQNNLTLMIVARTDSVVAAKNLSDTVEGLRQLGAMVVPRLTQPRRALAESALDNLKITTRGNELEIRTQIAAANLATLIK